MKFSAISIENFLKFRYKPAAKMVDLNKYNNNNIKYSRGKKARKSR